MSSTWQDLDDIDVSGSAGAGELTSTGTPVTAEDLMVSQCNSIYSPEDLEAYRPQSQATDLWALSGDSTVNFASPSIAQSPTARGGDILAGLLSADDELAAMLNMSQDSMSSTALGMGDGPLLNPWKVIQPPTPRPPGVSPASLLVRFREETDQRITTLDAYYSDPFKVVQGCQKDDADQEPENPAAILLTCIKELVDIIQSLTPTAQTHESSEDSLSTEILLLALSSYLSLMRLFDAMFHTIHKFISQMPSDAFKSVKVKSVLRIGGISSLQDMPLKAYATGIIDAIQGQMRTLERCMGIPTEYCLSNEASTSSPAATGGILSGADRAWLFCAVMAQHDVKSRRGSKSYVESIRASIQESLRFLND